MSAASGSKVVDFDDVEEAAKVAAEQYQPYAERYEGSRDFAIVDEKGIVTDVRVELEYIPVFMARTFGAIGK